MTNPLLPWERFGTQAVEGAVQGTIGQVETQIEQSTGIQLPQVQFPGPVPAAPLPQPAPEPVAVPTVAYEPTPTPAPAPAPAAPTAASGSAVSAIQAGIKEAIDGALPAIKEQALNYAKEELQATLSGQQIDQTHPTITVTTSKGKEMKVADAKSRSYRAFIQGLGLDLFFAILAMLGQLTDVDLVHKAGWVTLGALVFKTFAQTLVTYVSRMKITPSTVIDGNKVSLVTIPATSVTTLTAQKFVS